MKVGQAQLPGLAAKSGIKLIFGPGAAGHLKILPEERIFNRGAETASQASS
jgi:hypothetical protein